jgi:hypothetical protein
VKPFAPFLALALAAGCAGEPQTGGSATDVPAHAAVEVRAPKVPPFLNGPMAALLTNTGGFSARVVMETRPPSGQPEIVSGELLGRGSKLLFAADPDVSVKKSVRVGGISFIWDVARNNGYLLSEALQGYAPIASNVRFTNVVAGAGMEKSALEKIAGHPCEQAETIVTSSDGSVAAFHIWRAVDLKGFPVQITPATNATAPTVRFSKIRLEVPPGELFLPTDGFTKYENADAMMNELALRQVPPRPRQIPVIGEGQNVGAPGTPGSPGNSGYRRY